MKHDPADGVVRISETSEQLLDIVKCFRLLKLSFNKIVTDTFNRLRDHVGKEVSVLLYSRLSDVVLESFARSRKARPIRENVYEYAVVDRNNPVV